MVSLSLTYLSTGYITSTLCPYSRAVCVCVISEMDRQTAKNLSNKKVRPVWGRGREEKSIEFPVHCKM